MLILKSDLLTNILTLYCVLYQTQMVTYFITSKHSCFLVVSQVFKQYKPGLNLSFSLDTGYILEQNYFLVLLNLFY